MAEKKPTTRISSVSGEIRFQGEPPYSFNFSSESSSTRISATTEAIGSLLTETGDFLVQEDGGKLLL